MAHQIPIHTRGQHDKARIELFETQKLQKALGEGIIPIVAGFQGINKKGEINTLGRGGSDTTAIAMAHQLKANTCHIYTDVRGVYTADPRIVKDAQKIHQIDMEEMLELSSAGAKVMQVRAMELAYKLQTPIRVLSSFEEDRHGTLIDFFEDTTMETPMVRAVASKSDESSFTFQNLPIESNALGDIFGALSDMGVVVDVVSYTPIFEKQQAILSFTIENTDSPNAASFLNAYAQEHGFLLSSKTHVAKVSIVGVGMRSHPGIAHRAFSELARLKIPLECVGTSEIKISFVMSEEYMELATRALHQAFQLHLAQDVLS